MHGVICTLVEGRHFEGLAALINSLESVGFEGELFVGTRGPRPAWLTREAERLEALAGPRRLHLREIDRPGHMTNLKPHWMRDVWSERPHADRLIYLDPDVCVLAPWTLIEDWIGEGVAVAQDQQPALTRGHWLFKSWQRAFESHGYTLRQTPYEYFNAGFLGVHWEARSVLDRWGNMMAVAAEAFGGLEASNLNGGRRSPQISTPYAAFAQTDQDVLNAALRCGNEPLAIVGPEGMGFRPGPALMSHAVGPKPWAKPLVRQALRGIRPTFADRQFLKHSAGRLRGTGTASRAALAMRLQLARLLTARVRVPST
ncbi:MAG: hypothetical protein AAFX76_04030 [Planctomycetota bacterium]